MIAARAATILILALRSPLMIGKRLLASLETRLLSPFDDDDLDERAARKADCEHRRRGRCESPLMARRNGAVLRSDRGPRRMARFLIILGLTFLIMGLFWPYVSRLGLGRLPGDIVIERDNFTLYLPLTTCLLISLLFSAVLWLLNR